MDQYDSNIRKRYKQRGGRVSIELKLNNPHQLFDERDPAPFREKDLDDDAASYILGALRELPKGTATQISLYFDDTRGMQDAPVVIRKAIRGYFEHEEMVKAQTLRTMFKRGFISLAIGLSFLFITNGFIHYMEAEHIDMMTSFLHEGLHLMGWVAMWHPVSFFLYEWWPIIEEQRLYRRAANLEIEILPATAMKTELAMAETEKAAVTKPLALQTSS